MFFSTNTYDIYFLNKSHAAQQIETLLKRSLFPLLKRFFQVHYADKCRNLGSRDSHGCHILPFRPILWNSFFPSEPAKPPRTALNLFQTEVKYGK